MQGCWHQRAVQATPTIMPWPKVSMAFTKQKSYTVIAGKTTLKWNWQHWRGSTGTTIAGCSNASVTYRLWKQKKRIMLPSGIRGWQPELPDLTLFRKTGAVQLPVAELHFHQQTDPDKSGFRQCRLNTFANAHVARPTRIQARRYQNVHILR